MQQRAREAAAKGRTARVDQRWVPYARVSPLLRHAILVAEDDAFFAHGGLDWDEIREAARRDLERRRVVRGGSTITQQLAKNVFLGDERTLWRKLTEAFLALRLERALGKRRIFELYLNLIEWGDGIYGAEAAARRYFGVPASDLNPREAVLLAAVIINPRRYSPLHPSRRIERRAKMIARRLARRGVLSAADLAQAIGEPPVAIVPGGDSAVAESVATPVDTAPAVPSTPVTPESTAPATPAPAETSDTAPHAPQ
jgi:monofunctional biosynthetic peptidoglycan transglycosylase